MKNSSVSLVTLMLLVHGAFAEKLMIVLLDGFRWDYLDRIDKEDIPNFTNFLDSGSRTEYVQTIFPSLSWASWTTIATGLTAERHGILGNYMYNSETGLVFGLDYDDMRDPSWWDQHTPLWITATKEGLRATLYAWALCDVPFDDILPEKCLTLPGADHANDIDQLGDHLILASEDLAEGFDLAMIYYGNIDGIGHDEGPESPLIDEEIMRVDTKLGELYQSLDDLGIRDETNIVFVSDHGMTSQIGFTQTDMTHYLDPELIDMAVERVAYTNIKLTDLSRIDEAMESLSQWPGVDVYKKEDIPDHLHYRDNDLILDILVVAQEGNMIGQDYGNSDKFIPPAEPGDGEPDIIIMDEEHGHHGWDDTSQEPTDYEEGTIANMRAIFLANGPSFKSGYVGPWMKLIDEYQVFLSVLGLEGQEHEGTWERVEDMMASEEEETTMSTTENVGSPRMTHNNSKITLLILITVSLLFS